MITIVRKFVTVIPAGHRDVDNEYVRGRISAAMQIFCYCGEDIYMDRIEGGSICFNIVTREHLYKRFQECIEEWYPGMCKFDVTKGWREED